MRITNNMMTNMLLHNLNRNMYYMSKLQEQGADGKRIHRPSDDAIGISKILKFKSDLSDLDQYESNIRDSLSWFQVSESAVVDMSSAINRMRDLAVQAANTATNSPEDLAKIKAEVKELKSHIVNAGNFSYAGKYVFSGYQNDKPLLKTEIINGEEVVTYNVDITDRDIARPQKMRYAVGQAETIQVSTSGLELFGVVKKDYEDFDNVRFRLEGQFDLAKNYTNGQMLVNFDGKRFAVDNSKLDGSLSKEEIVKLFAESKYGKQKLSDLADVKFEQDNLIIESKTRGKKDLSLEHLDNATPPNAIPNGLEMDSRFRLRNKPYTYALRGDFDKSKDYNGKTIKVKMGDEVFEVNTASLTGSAATPLTKTQIENAFNNADYNGKKLSAVANVRYDDATGKLIIENKTRYNNEMSIETSSTFKPRLVWKHDGYDYGERIPLDHIVNAFSGMFTDSSGSDFEEGIGVLHGRFDPKLDYTNDTLDITLGGTTYDVDEKLLDGTKTPIDKALILERYRKAPATGGATGKLEDVADVYFDDHDNLVIKAKDFKKNKITVDLTGASASAAQPLEIEVNGKKYKVEDISSAATIGATKNLANEPLSNVVDVQLSGNTLTLTSLKFDNKKISINSVNQDQHPNMTYSFTRSDSDISSASKLMKFSDSTTGIAAKKSQLVGKFALRGEESDYRQSDLVYTIDGKNFTVDTKHLTGYGYTLKREQVLEEIRNASDGSGDTLSNHADVFFNQDGDLVVKHKKYGTQNTSISVSLTKKAGASAGYKLPSYISVFESGADAEEAEVKYDKFSFDDDYIKENEQKLKQTSLFITYNGERHEIKLNKDASFTDASTYKAYLQDAIDKKIGENKVQVDITTTSGVPVGSPDKHSLSFKTLATADGETPQIQVEPVVTNESSLIRDIDKFLGALENYDQDEINKFLGTIDTHLDRILAVRADIGAKTNRMELAVERTKDNILSFTKSLSQVEDVDMAETIMQLKNYENVYKASLSMGSKIIQPSLVDFIR